MLKYLFTRKSYSSSYSIDHDRECRKATSIIIRLLVSDEILRSNLLSPFQWFISLHLLGFSIRGMRVLALALPNLEIQNAAKQEVGENSPTAKCQDAGQM